MIHPLRSVSTLTTPIWSIPSRAESPRLGIAIYTPGSSSLYSTVWLPILAKHQHQHSKFLHQAISHIPSYPRYSTRFTLWTLLVWLAYPQSSPCPKLLCLPRPLINLLSTFRNSLQQPPLHCSSRFTSLHNSKLQPARIALPYLNNGQRFSAAIIPPRS